MANASHTNEEEKETGSHVAFKRDQTSPEVVESSLRQAILARATDPKKVVHEMSLMKRFDKMLLKTPASGLLSTAQQPRKFGLTPVMEDLAELDLSSKKK